MSTVKVFNSTGQEQEVLDLGFAIDGKELSPKTYACAVRVLLQNWRQGTLGHKTRGQVSFSGKKPWRQKGTGRARAGSARSPLWRKGGVIFGPEPRTRTLKMNRKQKRVAFRNLIQVALKSVTIRCIDFDLSSKEVPKTKDAYALLKSVGLEKKKGILFLPYDDVAHFAAFRNIPSVGVLSFDQPNVFDLSGTHYWMFLKKDLELFKNMVEKWT